jgi:RNA binding exosome subunit
MCCIAILNKQKCLFSKRVDRKVKQVLSESCYQWERGEHKERVKQGEHGGNIMYTYTKMEKKRPVDTILRREREEIKESDGGGGAVN